MSTEFFTHASGLKGIRVQNAAASAEILLLGAHLISYKPNSGKELIWMSKSSFFEVGKAIRGGTPICWPWFGPHATDRSLPSHGLVRTRLWEYAGSEEPDACTTICRFVIRDTPDTRKIWDYAFELVLEVTVSATLSMALTTRNTDAVPFTISQALHTYFTVQDIQQVEVLGFENKAYTDKAGGQISEKVMGNTPVTFSAEVDRVYHQAPGPYKLIDKGTGRIVTITNEGNNTGVTWNPWIEKAQKLGADYLPDGYKDMVCVETTNALEDARTLQPGQLHTLKTTYSIDN